jgi:hypothetical protein
MEHTQAADHANFGVYLLAYSAPACMVRGVCAKKSPCENRKGVF